MRQRYELAGIHPPFVCPLGAGVPFLLLTRRMVHTHPPLRLPRRVWAQVCISRCLQIGMLVWALMGTHAWAARPAAWQGVVTWVSDGDTVWVQDDEAQTHKVRVLGIDAPEICQAYGATAKEALQQRLLGQVVTVHGDRRDDYGRLLARLYTRPTDTVLEGPGAAKDPAFSNTVEVDVGRWMVQQGHAWSYRYRQDPGPYGREEQRARALALGLFAQGWPQRPRDFRRQHGPCHEPLPGRE